MKKIEVLNKKVGKLFVKEIIEKKENNSRTTYLCICDCGKEAIRRHGSLVRIDCGHCCESCRQKKCVESIYCGYEEISGQLFSTLKCSAKIEN